LEDDGQSLSQQHPSGVARKCALPQPLEFIGQQNDSTMDYARFTEDSTLSNSEHAVNNDTL
jgi:hypothetical protein